MAENSHIEWTHHTFNLWIGCTKISSACDFCYAEAWDKRGLHGLDPRWGPHAPRTRTSKATWSNPLKWQKIAKASGERKRVFCASLPHAVAARPVSKVTAARRTYCRADRTHAYDAICRARIIRLPQVTERFAQCPSAPDHRSIQN